jgi:hypothetical protein
MTSPLLLNISAERQKRLAADISQRFTKKERFTVERGVSKKNVFLAKN